METRPGALLLGPHRGAVSGVSTHLNLLLASRLAGEFSLAHFQVGSEGRSESRAAFAWRLLTSPLRLAATILARRAAIVHINTALNARAYWRDLAYLIVARICGARVLWQVHGGSLPQPFFGASRILAGFLRATLRLPHALVVLARVELEAYREFVPGQRVLLLPNGIDCASYAAVVRTRHDPASPLRLAYVGRLAREKGLDDALQGLALARAGGARARLVVAGSGPERLRLRRRADELGLAGEVSFEGPVFGEDKARLLGATDATLFASHGEGLPYALLESMAAGVPAIATSVGGIPDVVVDGVHGLLVPPRDARGIARAIEKLAADRELLARMSAACRQRIAAGYSIDRLAEQFRSLYSELCAAGQANAPGRF
ncbi:MAG TPA: glycosyltransferase family 4 protein [Burkholderiales bacterium]|nr:glycosyltransferase family 4 protein [Burkholderiales bacterium]